jgi:lipoate-protein ligase A
MPVFRTIDTGLRDGRAQIAFDEALIELHKAGRIPDTVRFLRFPPTALIGRHQAMSHEVKVDHCRANGIGLVRRITGGGAIYFDEGQIGWELVLSRKRLPMPSLGDYTRAICEAAAHGLSQTFGVEARFRPRNDIEVGGQKLCGTGGFFDGDTLFYQGTVLIDVDPARMMACLNVPAAKLQKRDLDKAEQRVTTLKALLGGTAPEIAKVQEAILLGFREKLGLTLEPGAPSEVEETLAKRIHDETIGTDDFVFEIDDPRGGERGVADGCGGHGLGLRAARRRGQCAARARAAAHRRFLRDATAHGARSGSLPAWGTGRGSGGHGGSLLCGIEAGPAVDRARRLQDSDRAGRGCRRR